MAESIINISIVGLLAGFIFSMPVAGPVSILITTSALKGRFRHSVLVNLGASLATFTYVFFAVFGLSKLYPFYKPAVPYLFILGSLFLLFVGYRIFRTKIDFEHFDVTSHFNEKIKKKETGGFYTGLIINFLNPALFLGWLTSTFLVLSFVSSLGLYTGGLNKFVAQSVKDTESNYSSSIQNTSYLFINDPAGGNKPEDEIISEKERSLPKNFHFLISIIYAAFICAGSIIWFYLLALSITRFRRYINFKYLSAFIKSMGIVLCIIGLYFGYLAAGKFLQ